MLFIFKLCIKVIYDDIINQILFISSSSSFSLPGKDDDYHNDDDDDDCNDDDDKEDNDDDNNDQGREKDDCVFNLVEKQNLKSSIILSIFLKILQELIDNKKECNQIEKTN